MNLSAFPNFLFVKNSSNCHTLSGIHKNSHCSFFNVQNLFLCRPSRNNSFIISHPSVFVNTFFESFFSFFQNSLSASLFCTVSRRQLYYITTSPPLCQHFFLYFFSFVQISDICFEYSFVPCAFYTIFRFLYIFLKQNIRYLFFIKHFMSYFIYSFFLYP